MVKKSMRQSLVVLFSLTMLTACKTAASRNPASISAGSLAEEYERSSAQARSKYDGKEIIVRGYALTVATMPQPGDDQGSMLLGENEHPTASRVACWFSKSQAEQFSKVKIGNHITVSGIFNGEAGAELKFCKLGKIE